MTFGSLQSHESAAIDHAKLTPSQPLADSSLHHNFEPVTVAVVAFVEPKNLFVEIALQVERCAMRVRALERPLEKRPEIFDAVDVDATRNIARRVVDELVNKIAAMRGVRCRRVGVNVRFSSATLRTLAA